MGIKGLNSLFNNNPNLSKPYELHDTRVVFDGCNLINYIYYSCKVPCGYGGDYDRYGALVKGYFSSYLQCNIIPIVILDGGQDKTDMKLRTIIERKKASIESVDRIAKYQSEENVLPVFAYNVFIDVIKEMNIVHAQCSFEADGPITAIANHYECPVISLDSDFYVFDIGSGFIRSDTVDTTPKVGKTGLRQYKYLSCRIYTVDHFLSFFPRLQKSVFPLLGTLSGNDYINASTFDNFFQSPEFPSGNSTKLKIRRTYKRLVGLLEWLRRYNEVDDAIADVLTYVPQEQRQHVRQLVKQAIDAYRVSEPYLLKYIDPSPGIPDSYSASVKETLVTFGNKSLPTWFVDNFHKANMSSYVMNVIGLRRMILPTQVEDTALPTSHDCFLAIRQVLYGILASLDGISSDGIYVVEYDRLGGNEIQNRQVKPIVQLEGFGPLPRLSERQMSTRDGKLLVSFALGEQNTCLDDLPDSLKLVVMSIRYWLLRCSPKPTECFFVALLLTVSYLEITESASSDVSNLPTAEFAESNSVLDVMGEVQPGNVDVFRKRMKNYCQKPPHDNTNPLDMNIIHSYAQLQSCVLFSLLINEVTGQPFSTPKMQRTFSGSLIYNLTSQLRKKRSVETFIERTLDPRSALGDLFGKLRSKILENIPIDCIRRTVPL